MSSPSNHTSMMTLQEYISGITIPYEERASATNNFSEKNIISQVRTSGIKLYKGQLSESVKLIDIVAGNPQSKSQVVFNELHISFCANHKNIDTVFKISEKSSKEIILIRKHVANGSLNKYLSGSQTLTWIQRLRICVGVSHALSYLHNSIIGDDHSFIHGNIKSSKILLDDQWEPKLCGFGHSMMVKKGDAQLVTDQYLDKSGYRDPAYKDTKSLTHKSDVFSFGVVLFEVLFGKEASTYSSLKEEEDDDDWCFARFTRQHYEEKGLDDVIDPDLRRQINLQSLSIFSETAYFCLMEVRSQRPDMDQVVRKLEKALKIQLKHDQTQGKNVDHLKIPLSDIYSATQKFSKSCKIGSGGFGMVYKADLYHFDATKSSAIEAAAKSKCEFPKVQSTVAIKHIFKREDLQGEQGFIREIELLSNCKHPNVVSLLGYCDEGPEMILIYDYASNGSLASYLGNPDNLTNLTWAQRIQISIDIAHGLSYLHTSTKEKKTIIHRDLKSANVLLDSNCVAKIADFGLSKIHHRSQQGSTLVTNNVAGTEFYLDPEYIKTGKLKRASDIYSFGVVLFEMLCGRLAYDPIYQDRGLPSIVTREPFNKQRLKKMVDPKIMEADANILKITGGLDRDSLDTFITIAYKCLAQTQAQRPQMEIIIKELEKALDSQKNSKDNFQMSFSEITLATKSFRNFLGAGRYWKLYEGETHGDSGIVKRWDNKSDPKHHHEFLTELEVLFKYKHECIIGLAGYCNEMDEKIIVYEHGYNGRLDKHLDDVSLTWAKRLKIGIDVAKGLEFLHTGGANQENPIKHRLIKSSCILLNSNFKAKIANLELCIDNWELEKFDHSSSDLAYNSLGYNDPETNSYLTEKLDIYALGVVLIEMLCGRLALPEGYDEDGNLDGMIFEGIKEQIVPQSLTTFQKIALQCLNFDEKDRPWASDVLVQLDRALELQEDIEIWEAKLPRDYKEILKMSTTPGIYYIYTKTRKEVYEMFHKGILLQGGKRMFSLSNNDDCRNEMISARMFSYGNHKSHKSRSVQNTRFPRVVKMLDISKLNIQIKIKPQFISKNVNYGAYLVFKFCDPRKFSNQPIYVNLKYKVGWQTLHAYFAEWRDDKWMMIELCQFVHDNNDNHLKIHLESFSRYYCGSGGAYIEGIEFRAINDARLKAQPEQYEKRGVQPIDSHKRTKLDAGEKLRSQTEANLQKFYMLPAKMIISDSCNAKCFVWKSLPKSRFEEVAEFISDQVIRIKCHIESQELSQNTDYTCYLIFKLAENCGGLQCRVKLRENRTIKFLYFKTPSTLNLHNIKRVPKVRDDGLMEVIVLEFNSNKLNGDYYPINLKLKCYEGTMRGLIVHGIEFRPK